MLKQFFLPLGFSIAFVTTFFAQNLIKNGDCELPTVNGKIQNWIEVQGNEWRPANVDVQPQNGQYYFFASGPINAELMQEVDVTDYACPIDGSRQRFDFKGFVRSFPQNPPDYARIVIEYRNANNAVLSTYDSGNQTPTSAWLQLTDIRLAPVGTRKIRIRLISTRRAGTENDGYYDNLSLVPNPTRFKMDSIYKTTATCSNANGSARISISGGALPLQFKLNNQALTTDSVFRNLNTGNYNVLVTDAANCTVMASFSIPNLPPPSLVSYNATPSVCGRKNGNLTVVAQSGTGSLTYQLDNNAKRSQPKFDSLAAGNYLLTIRDSIGCTDTITLIVPDKSRPVIDSILIAPANCNKNNGKLSVFGRAQTSTIQFSLDSVGFVSSSIFPNLKDSSYTVFVRDSNKCVTSQKAVIPRVAAPKFDTVTVRASYCNIDNGSIRVAAQNVTFSIDSLVFNTTKLFNRLRSGNYTIYIRDSTQCVVSQKVVLPKILPPTIEEIKAVPESCKKHDGQIIVKASSLASSLTYSIDNGSYTPRDSFLSLTSGIFLIIVRDTFGCQIVQNVTLKSQPVPIVEEVKTAPSECQDSTGVVLIKVKVGGDFSYSLNGTKFQTDNLFRKVKSGRYNVIIKDQNDCRTTVEANVERECGFFIPTAFSPNEDGNNDFFTFFGDASKVDKVLDFKVFNRWGILLYSDNTVQMNNITSGWDGKFRGQEVESSIYVYFIKIQMKDGTTIVEKGDVTLMR